MKLCFELFSTFFRIGLFTFGGGIAMLPMLTRHVVGEKKWATEDELMDYYAVGQCTPGIIAVNTATFVGMKKKGVSGAFFATLGVIMPSLIIIILIASLLNEFSDNAVIENVFAGIRISVCALVIVSASKIIKKAVTDIPTLLILLAAFLSAVFIKLSPVIIVLIAAVFGVLIKSIGERKK